MSAQPVEWVLVIYYGQSAHRATYGRLKGTKYTKDYIQLSRKKEFLDTVTKLFSVNSGEANSVPLTYRWPAGNALGEFVFKSADRPHLKWETSQGAPKAWKMALAPSEATAETIPGDPSHLDFASAEEELALLAGRGAGQPYLMAIKLRDEPRTLHLRVYLSNPSKEFAWANIEIAPAEIQELAEATSQKSALAWSVFQSGGVASDESTNTVLSKIIASSDLASVVDALGVRAGRALATYLQNPGYGLFFDPNRNHDAWLVANSLPEPISKSINDLLEMLDTRYPAADVGDAAAETLESSEGEVDVFREQIEQKSYEVPDLHATTKTRGSAQKAFAEAVKKNYGFQCAITGIKTKNFLVASHIVPWSEDRSIRLDPSNGICLSLLMDRAFEKGYILIDDDLTVRIDADRIGDDEVLKSELEPFHEQKLKAPAHGSPKPEYLQRRRALLSPSK